MTSHTAHSDIPVNASDYACIDLINTAFTDYLGSGPARDRIASTRWLRWFLDRYTLETEDRDVPPVAELVKLRRELRRILERWSLDGALSSRDVRVLDGRINAAPMRQRLVGTADGMELFEEPLQRDWAWVIASVAISAVELVLTGDPKRLKTCANPNCSWLFYDATINRSKQYCSTTPCALLIRMRRFRETR